MFELHIPGTFLVEAFVLLAVFAYWQGLRTDSNMLFRNMVPAELCFATLCLAIGFVAATPATPHLAAAAIGAFAVLVATWFRGLGIATYLHRLEHKFDAEVAAQSGLPAPLSALDDVEVQVSATEFDRLINGETTEFFVGVTPVVLRLGPDALDRHARKDAAS